MNPLTGGEDVRGEWGYEMKFLAPAAIAEQALAWARASLAPDGGNERPLPIRSLYFDTPDLDIYHRVGKQGRRKYRVRRCGDAPVVTLERKTKSKGLVRERCSAIEIDDLDRLAAPYETPGWAGDWFHRDLLRHRLDPVCRIDYERLLRAGVLEEQPVRLSVDRNVRCAPAAASDAAAPALCLADTDDRAEPLTPAGESIVEIRFADALPAALKALLRDLDLAPRGISKYRLGIEACGLQGGPRPGGGAHAR